MSPDFTCSNKFQQNSCQNLGAIPPWFPTKYDLTWHHARGHGAGDRSRTTKKFKRRTLANHNNEDAEMADYYPLITKAVTGLGRDAPGERRRTVYERARAALLTQLRTLDPPFTEAEVACELLALEEAVRRVEGEATGRPFDTHAPLVREEFRVFDDIATDADELAEVAARTECRHHVSPVPLPTEMSDEIPSIIVMGSATGRLSPIWRWRSRVSQ